MDTNMNKITNNDIRRPNVVVRVGADRLNNHTIAKTNTTTLQTTTYYLLLTITNYY